MKLSHYASSNKQMRRGTRTLFQHCYFTPSLVSSRPVPFRCFLVPLHIFLLLCSFSCSPNSHPNYLRLQGLTKAWISRCRSRSHFASGIGTKFDWWVCIFITYNPYLTWFQYTAVLLPGECASSYSHSLWWVTGLIPCHHRSLHVAFLQIRISCQSYNFFWWAAFFLSCLIFTNFHSVDCQLSYQLYCRGVY